MILHSDQGSVYCSKRLNESLHLYNIIHSTSKPGSPTENGAMEAINGWIKEELFIDFKINDSNDIFKSIEDYIYYFNNERPQCTLNYLTPIQFKNINMLNNCLLLLDYNIFRVNYYLYVLIIRKCF